MPFDLPGISTSRNMSYWYLEMCTKEYVTWIFTAVLFVIGKDGELPQCPPIAIQQNTKKSVKRRQFYMYKYGVTYKLYG